MSKLDKDTLLKTLRGFEEVNRITEAERRARLQTISDEEALKSFESLYASWKQTGKRADGEWAAIEEQRIEAHLKVRRAFEQLARMRGLIP